MVVGFTGKMGSGKDTAGERLAFLSERPATRLGFADLLKESAAALFDFHPSVWETAKNDPNATITFEQGGEQIKLTAREFLQRYGTEAHREIFADDFWVDAALVPAKHDRRGLYYVTDCRFPNEAEQIKRMGGVVIQVHGPGESAVVLHASEQQLAPELIDFHILNENRDDGYQALDTALRSIAAMVGIPLKLTGSHVLEGSSHR